MNPLTLRKHYTARETRRMQELDGAVLASFGERAAAFLIDCAAAFLIFIIVMAAISIAVWAIQTDFQFGTYSWGFDAESGVGKTIVEIVIPVLYFGLSTWIWNGRTLGKRLMKIRAVSLVHDHMSLWHSIERALGYAAAALEFGFGFFQFFIHPNRRTVQDRIAETIVVSDRVARQVVAPTAESATPPDPALSGSERG
jgi:uncharacterized RDD family membrane protein YckC